MGATSSTDKALENEKRKLKEENLRKRFLSKTTRDMLEDPKLKKYEGYRRNVSERLTVRRYDED